MRKFKKIKILFYIESLRKGGKERRLIELIKGLRNHPYIDCEILLTNNDIEYDNISNLKIKIHYLSNNRKSSNLKLFYKTFIFIKNNKFDLVHSWGYMETLFSIIPVRFFKIKLINSMITSAPEKIKYLSKLWLVTKITTFLSHKIISNSFAGLKSHGISDKKAVCIHNGFNFNRLANMESKESIRLKYNIKTTQVAVMVASFSNKKDYSTYIKAAIHILDDKNDISFLCVGAGDDSLYKKTVPAKYTDSIKFLGMQEDVESIINMSDIGVLCTYTEGISNSVMEYMALCKPVIATNGGGTSELVKDGETGYLISPTRYDELKSKINYLLSNPDIAIKIGKAGHKRIVSHFNIDDMVSKTINLYNEVLNDC